MQGYTPALSRIAGNVKPRFIHSDVLAYVSTGTYGIETLRHAVILPIVRGWNAASIFVTWLCGTLTKQRIRKHRIFQSTVFTTIYISNKRPRIITDPKGNMWQILNIDTIPYFIVRHQKSDKQHTNSKIQAVTYRRIKHRHRRVQCYVKQKQIYTQFTKERACICRLTSCMLAHTQIWNCVDCYSEPRSVKKPMEKQEAVSETQGNCSLHVHGALRWTDERKFQNKLRVKR